MDILIKLRNLQYLTVDTVPTAPILSHDSKDDCTLIVALSNNLQLYLNHIKLNFPQGSCLILTSEELCECAALEEGEIALFTFSTFTIMDECVCAIRYPYLNFGQVHRHEFSGALNGLLRVRTFCQDDAHIFVTPAQIEDEIALALQIIDHVYQVFGFEYEIELSTRPEEYMGELALWDQAEEALEHVLNQLGYAYKVNYGDGAFYGPKIDIHIRDAIKRSHQCATIQLDFQLPEKFDLTYINEENEKVRPVVLHRAVFGSIDRFLGILIEHFGGVFPLWLAPQQVRIIGVSDVHLPYVTQVKGALCQANIRAEIDQRNEKLGRKIRDAKMQKVPYILVLGDEEQQEGTVTVRAHQQEALETVSVDAFIQKLEQEIRHKLKPLQ